VSDILDDQGRPIPNKRKKVVQMIKRIGRSWSIWVPIVISLLALGISIASIGVSIWSSVEQKRQWRATSLGRVEITDVSFISWRTYSEEELKNTKWGYKVGLQPILEDNKVSKLYSLPSRLIAYDPTNKRPYPNVTGLTLDEIQSKLQNSQGLPNSVIPAKQFQLQWRLQNVGATAVSDFKIAVDKKLPDSEQWEESDWGQPAEVGPGRIVSKLLDLFAPVNLALPEKMSFRVRLEYVNIENDKIERSIPVYYDSLTGAFNFGE